MNNISFTIMFSVAAATILGLVVTIIYDSIKSGKPNRTLIIILGISIPFLIWMSSLADISIIDTGTSDEGNEDDKVEGEVEIPDEEPSQPPQTESPKADSTIEGEKGFSLDNPVTANLDWKPVFDEFNGVTMALVPIGCFDMGGNASDEKPVTTICFEKPFWIDTTEVTNNQYGSSGQFSGSNYPRESVNWFESVEHCKKRGARLPTEAEWEYAARGPDRLVYTWGNSFDGDKLNSCDASCEHDWNNPLYNDGYKETAPVGSFQSGISWIGAYDMNGNVWEWVSSIYKSYPYKASDGREDMSNISSPRILRGGTWSDGDTNIYNSKRNNVDPLKASIYDGFRCAKDY